MATAERIRQLMCPGTAGAQTVRNGCLDVGRDGLVESLGSASRTNTNGNLVFEKLGNLTGPGLEAAAAVLDRPVREMGGTARGAARSGAKHAVKVTDTLAAFLQTPPEPTRPVPRKQTQTATNAPSSTLTGYAPPLPPRPFRNARRGSGRSAPGRRRWCSRSPARSPPLARTAPAPTRSSPPRKRGCR
ncbi:hypothetical protein [Streptomyces sp. CA2R101]|uniref:hypothetical protein n=1 Tax=Streptomyces sp. CA2R101 TaxID=3120152 RepID=UPI003008C359